MYTFHYLTNNITTLKHLQVCKFRATEVCLIKDMTIICGRQERRRQKRDTGEVEVLSSVNFVFNVTALNFEEQTKDWQQICQSLRVPRIYRRRQFCIKILRGT